MVENVKYKSSMKLHWNNIANGMIFIYIKLFVHFVGCGANGLSVHLSDSYSNWLARRIVIIWLVHWIKILTVGKYCYIVTKYSCHNLVRGQFQLHGKNSQQWTHQWGMMWGMRSIQLKIDLHPCPFPCRKYVINLENIRKCKTTHRWLVGKTRDPNFWGGDR